MPSLAKALMDIQAIDDALMILVKKRERMVADIVAEYSPYKIGGTFVPVEEWDRDNSFIVDTSRVLFSTSDGEGITGVTWYAMGHKVKKNGRKGKRVLSASAYERIGKNED